MSKYVGASGKAAMREHNAGHAEGKSGSKAKLLPGVTPPGHRPAMTGDGITRALKPTPQK